MRSFGRALAATLAVVVLAPGLPGAQPGSQARDLYEEAVAREAALRREIDAYHPDSPSSSLLRRVRVLVTSYEDFSRLFPASSYSDNALWQGAELSAEAFWQFGDAADRARALQLFESLAARFPASSLVKQVPAHVKRLMAVNPGKAFPSSGSSEAAALEAVRREVLPDALRITLEVEREVSFQHEKLDGPPRVFIDLQNTAAVDRLKDATIPFQGDVVRRVRVGRPEESRTRVVLDLNNAARYSVYALYNPFRVVVDFERAAPIVTPVIAGNAHGATPPPSIAPTSKITIAPTGEARIAPTSEVRIAPTSEVRIAPTSEAKLPPTGEARIAPTSEARIAPTGEAPIAPSANSGGGFSLSRQLGLGVARIVIDPGHGGQDPGAKVKGLTEAALVLDVALRLEKLLLKQPGVEVLLTRRTNRFVPLEERTSLANRASADLFLSIHANASRNTAARGVETYFLNFAPNQEAEAIAARENAGSAKTMRNLPDIVRAIALNDKVDESRNFAWMVQATLHERLRTTNRNLKNLGVKQAPFMVLIGATMPSVLAEISFMTNREEADLLKTEKYRQQIADALLAAVMQYQQSLKRVPAVAAN